MALTAEQQALLDALEEEEGAAKAAPFTAAPPNVAVEPQEHQQAAAQAPIPAAAPVKPAPMKIAPARDGRVYPDIGAVQNQWDDPDIARSMGPAGLMERFAGSISATADTPFLQPPVGRQETWPQYGNRLTGNMIQSGGKLVAGVPLMAEGAYDYITAPMEKPTDTGNPMFDATLGYGTQMAERAVTALPRAAKALMYDPVVHKAERAGELAAERGGVMAGVQGTMEEDPLGTAMAFGAPYGMGKKALALGAQRAGLMPPIEAPVVSADPRSSSRFSQPPERMATPEEMPGREGYEARRAAEAFAETQGFGGQALEGTIPQGYEVPNYPAPIGPQSQFGQASPYQAARQAVSPKPQIAQPEYPAPPRTIRFGQASPYEQVRNAGKRKAPPAAPIEERVAAIEKQLSGEAARQPPAAAPVEPVPAPAPQPALKPSGLPQKKAPPETMARPQQAPDLVIDETTAAPEAQPPKRRLPVNVRREDVVSASEAAGEAPRPFPNPPAKTGGPKMNDQPEELPPEAQQWLQDPSFLAGYEDQIQGVAARRRK